MFSIQNNNFPLAIKQGLTALFMVLKQYSNKNLDPERIAKIAVFLIKSGVDKNNSTLLDFAERCSILQKADGGWVGIEDSVWILSFLKEFQSYSQEYKHGLEWLITRQSDSGGWGKTCRDIGRIPITGILLYLLPELSAKENLEWLEQEWKKEFSQNPKLTYKAAFSLMAIKKNYFQFINKKLFYETLDWLSSQYNADFGWGPSKDHPVGSTPFCTGVALTGILQDPNRINKEVIVNGLTWIEKNQLENGLWADHYIEEGSTWSLYALIEGYKFLKGIQ